MHISPNCLCRGSGRDAFGRTCMLCEARRPPVATKTVTVYATQRRYYEAKVEVVVPAAADDETALAAARAEFDKLPADAWSCADSDAADLIVTETEEDDPDG